MLGPMSNYKACCAGEIQGQISQCWIIGAYDLPLTRDRYWEAKLAPGHVPSEAYVELEKVQYKGILTSFQKNREFYSDQI